MEKSKAKIESKFKQEKKKMEKIIARNRTSKIERQ